MMTGWRMMREPIVQIFIARILVSNIMYNNKYFCGILCDIVLFCLILYNIVQYTTKLCIVLYHFVQYVQSHTIHNNNTANKMDYNYEQY